MKSAKKVRVPRNKKITPKRKKMRSKPRKQSKKRKHRGGEVGASCNPKVSGSCNNDLEWCAPNTFDDQGTCQERATTEKALEYLYATRTEKSETEIEELRKKMDAKFNPNIGYKEGNLNYSNCEVISYIDKTGKQKKILNQKINSLGSTGKTGTPTCLFRIP